MGGLYFPTSDPRQVCGTWPDLSFLKEKCLGQHKTLRVAERNPSLFLWGGGAPIDLQKEKESRILAALSYQ